MWDRVTVTTPAAALPLSAADLRDRLRIDDVGEDALLADFIAAAASEIEGPQALGIAMMAQEWTVTLDRFSSHSTGAICLPGWPVTGISEIRFMDTDGAWQNIDPLDFRLVKGAEPARLVPARGFSWPAVLAGPGVIEITYALGRAKPGEVDAGLITALALLAGHYYENREAVAVGVTATEIPLGAAHILARFRRGLVAG